VPRLPTIIRKVLNLRAERLEAAGNKKGADQALRMLETVEGNIGFVFCPNNVEIGAIREEITSERVQTAAKAGVEAPDDVVVPAGQNGQDPFQTSFFQAFSSAVREVAALCLALNYPTAASVPHFIMVAYKNILAIGLASKDYSWENLVKVKEILADPSAFAAATDSSRAPLNFRRILLRLLLLDLQLLNGVLFRVLIVVS